MNAKWKLSTGSLLTVSLPPIQCQQEKLYLGAQFVKQENAASGRNPQCSPLTQSVYTESSHPGSVWSNFMQMRNPNLHSLIGPNNTVLISWNCMCRLVVKGLFWLVSKDVNETIAVQFCLIKASLSPLVERRFQKLLSKGQLRRQKHRPAA